jgi:hypothetical protein
MEQVRLQPGQYFAPVLAAIAAYAFQLTSAAPLWPNMAMIMLAAALQMANIVLSDAEFRAYTALYGLNAQDIFGRICTVCFDALLLFGLISGAGYHLFWNTYVSIAGALLLAMPLVTLLQLRGHYGQGKGRPGFGLRHWMPPAFLAILGLMIWTSQGVQTASGSQPFVFMIVLSLTLMGANRDTIFVGGARSLRFATLAGGIALIVWNYLNLT